MRVIETARISDLFDREVRLAQKRTSMFDTCFLQEIFGREVEQLVHFPIEGRTAHPRGTYQIIDRDIHIAHVRFHESSERLE